MKRNWFFEWIRIYYELTVARWNFFKALHAVSRLKTPIITVFGGTMFGGKGSSYENNYEKEAYELARKCVEHGFSILTGGGPGIMEASNCGAASIAKKRTLGISVQGIDKDYKNPCAAVVHVSDFFVRKWLLMRYSSGFIIFPGGIGTAEELFELLNRMKYGKTPELPVVLIGTKYWHSLVDWYKNSGLKYGIIPEQCSHYLRITDDINEAFKIVNSNYNH